MLKLLQRQPRSNSRLTDRLPTPRAHCAFSRSVPRELVREKRLFPRKKSLQTPMTITQTQTPFLRRLSLQQTQAFLAESFPLAESRAPYEIANVQGQVVKSGKVEASINLAGLKAGIYMVRISGKSVNMNKKILLK